MCAPYSSLSGPRAKVMKGILRGWCTFGWVGGKLLQGVVGSYEPPFQDPPPKGGVGLFCQAITGADGLHGTDRGAKNKKK